ncbi:MAG: CapA family protein [Clostridiales Family XIII bacterium]|jgi:poly-gamma-glutamate synthesis protein (capsule biosynthesis protein)|nr:CapA family protein [Clostridiales Family XIII bacterium]
MKNDYLRKIAAGAMLAASFALLAPLFSACAGGGGETGGAQGADSLSLTPPAITVAALEDSHAAEPTSARLLFAGDVMVHEPQLLAQFDNTTKDYDFRNNYSFVKPYIESADLALCNLETTLGGSPYRGYPSFSSPDSLADALLDAGFDAVFTSNNHMMDKGATGLTRTIETLRAAGLKNVGSQLEGEPNYMLLSAGAINVGLVSYTYESPRYNGTRTLNGIPVKAEIEPMVNSFGFETLEADMAAVEGAVGAARASGADFVVCYFHWGNEYHRSPDDNQRQIAARIAQAGADLIVASHPHVLQGMETLEANGRKVPVYYSMGNFISNQRTETTGSRYTEQGMMVLADLKLMPDSRKLLSLDTKALPTWVDKYNDGRKNVYHIIPLTGDFMNNPSLLESGHGERARQALEYCVGLFGDGQIYKEQ